MPHLMLKHIPRYECFLEAARSFPELDPSACEAYLHLLRAGDEAFRISSCNFVVHGMSPGRFTVLMMLINKEEGFVPCEPRTPAELADLAGVTRATMTGLIDTLERDGWVKREPDAEDRRMMLVRLTPAGHAALLKMLPAHFAQMSAIMAPLSETERKTLVMLLNKVIEHTDTLGVARPAASVSAEA